MRLSKFLKKHKVYKQFKNNFDIDYYKYKECDSVSIIDAFKWRDSLEGYTFWINIDNLWDNVKKKKYDLVVKNGKIKKS